MWKDNMIPVGGNLKYGRLHKFTKYITLIIVYKQSNIKKIHKRPFVAFSNCPQ